MTVDVETSIEIDRPRAVVAGFATEPDNAPRWYVNIRSVAWETPRPLLVGSRFAFVAHFLGRELAYTYEVREHVPGERFVMSTSQGPFPWRRRTPGRTLPTAAPGCSCATAGSRRVSRRSLHR